MLAGNVVTTAIREASLREQIAESEEIVALQARQLAIAERMEALGGVARVDVVAQQRDLAQARAALPDLRRDLERMRHRLALYVGVPPERAGAARVPSGRAGAAGGAAAEPAVAAGAPAPGHPLGRGAAGPGRRAGRRRHREPLSAADAVGAAGRARHHAPATCSPAATASTFSARRWSTACSAAASCRPGAARPSRPTSRPARPTRRRCCRRCRTSPTCCARSKPMPPGSRSAPTRKSGHAACATSPRRGSRPAASARPPCSKRRASTIARMLEQTQAAADRYADSAALLQALGGGWWQEAK